MKSSVVRDDRGAGRDGEKEFERYREAVERSWDQELAVHDDPMLDLVFKIDTRTSNIEIDYRPAIQGWRPSKSAGEYLGLSANRDAVWIWMVFASEKERVLFALTRK